MSTKNDLFDIDQYFAIRFQQEKKYRPSAVQIDLTNHCNANCLFCFQGKHIGNEKDLPLEIIEKTLIDIKNMGGFRIGFDGGEPYCRQDFSEILKIASELGYSISIVTNGTLLTDKDIELLKKISLSKISVSIHSYQKDKYSKIMGLPEKSLDTVIDNIKKLKEAELNVGIAVTVNKFNVEDAEEILDISQELGIPYKQVGFNHMLPGKNDISDLRITQKQKYDLAKVIIKYRGKEALTHTKENLICGAGRNAAHITYDGTVYACPFLNISAGNINDLSFHDIWENAPIFKILRSVKDDHFISCLKCDNRKYCSMCFCYNLAYQNNLFEPYQDNCKYAAFLSDLCLERKR